MFDWNDRELSELWDEADMSDDHIVPYPEGGDNRPPGSYGDEIKKEEKGGGTNAKPVELKEFVSISNHNGVKHNWAMQYISSEEIFEAEYGMDHWPGLSLSHAAKTDQQGMETEAYEASQLDQGSEFFQNEHNDKEHNDLDDYGWDNMGCLDDLDRIFSNDDPVFGHASLGNADQLWSSSKDVPMSPEKSLQLTMDSSSSGFEALRNQSGRFEIEREYAERGDQYSFHGYGKMSYHTSYAQQNVQESVKLADYAGDKHKLVTKEEDSEMLRNTMPFNLHLAAGRITTLTEETSEGSKNPLSGSPSTSKPVMMTPQEKIEKLRRRQQMQALFAIQNQQKQLSHQVSDNDHSIVQKDLCKNHTQPMQGGNTDVEDNVGILPSICKNSPIEQDDSNAIPMVVDDHYTMEDTILYQLQDIISKLDMQTRICIRDSLFRLTQSAMQRQFSSDRSSTNNLNRDKCKVLPKEENTRYSQTSDVETETNPIDRTVAHLLFHGPIMDPSSMRPSLDTFKSKRDVSLYHESKHPKSLSEGGWSTYSPCMDTFENASNAN